MGNPQLVSTEPGRVQAFNHLDKADTFPVDLVVSQASAEDFDGLVLPGGVANPDALRTNAEAVAFVQSFFDGGKPVAAICHAPWTLVEMAGSRPHADLVAEPAHGRRERGRDLGRRGRAGVHGRPQHARHQP